jgi:hypothetical protein
MNTPTILINVSKKKQNKLLESKNNVNYYIINENTRKVICNMFDALGNISNYTDYYAFQSNHPNFKAFCKCQCTHSIKISLDVGQGILVAIDTATGELHLPQQDIITWILNKHEYEILQNIPSENKDVVEEPKKIDDIPKKIIEEVKEDVKESSEKVEEPKKEEQTVGYTNRFWKMFGY